MRTWKALFSVNTVAIAGFLWSLAAVPLAAEDACRRVAILDDAGAIDAAIVQDYMDMSIEYSQGLGWWVCSPTLIGLWLTAVGGCLIALVETGLVLAYLRGTLIGEAPPRTPPGP